MQIRITLDTGGAAIAGVDRDELVADIQAEVDKLAGEVGTETAKPDYEAAPRDAQGDISVIQWLIEVATDPEMAKFYARALILSINAILSAAKSKETKDNKKGSKGPKPDDANDRSIVRISVLGKEFMLPATTSAIKSILNNLGDE